MWWETSLRMKPMLWVAECKDKECWAAEVTKPEAGPNLKSSIIWENTFPLFLPAWGRVSVISNGNHPHGCILHIQPISKSSLFFFLNISESTHLSPSALLIMISFGHHAGLIWATAKPPIASIPWFVGIGPENKVRKKKLWKHETMAGTARISLSCHRADLEWVPPRLSPSQKAYQVAILRSELL